MNTMVDLFLGAVFIIFYAAGRFNTPATNRSSTTAIRYFLGLFCYCVVGLVAYISFVKFPHLLAFLMQGNDAAVEPWAKQLSSPLLVALLLTVLLPKLPLLSELDNWVRKQLQDMAEIPHEARRLSRQLRKEKLYVSDETQATVRQKLEQQGINEKNVCFESGHTAACLWTRIGVLLEKLEDWESDRKMSGYLGSMPSEIDQLRKRYEQLLPKAKMCFRLQNEGAESFTTRTHEAMVRYQEDFSGQLAQLHDAILDFISRGVLHAELTDATRLNRLRVIGFSVEWRRRAFTFNQAMLVFGIVFIVMLACMVAFSGATNGVSFGMMLVRLVMVAVIYCIAVACAVLPKERWNFAKHRPGEIRPVGFYVVSGLIAVALSQFLSLMFNCVIMRSVEAGAQRFLFSYPWLLSTFATTIVLGILIDNKQSPRLSRTQQRVIEAFVQGLVMAGVAYMTRLWLMERAEHAASLLANYRVPDLERMMTTAGIIGFILGFCIPTWFREAPRARVEAKEAEETLELVAYDASAEPSI
jgi:hypothetical protein